MMPATARGRDSDCASVLEKAPRSVQVLYPLKQSRSSWQPRQDLEAKGELGAKEGAESEELGGVG